MRSLNGSRIVAPPALIQETVPESSHVRQDDLQEQPSVQESVLKAPPIRSAEEVASALRLAFLNCFGYAPPHDPLLLSERERADLWLSISAANGVAATAIHDRCRTAQVR